MSLVDTTTGEVVARRTFEENEQVIKAGLGTFVEVGTALAEIRDARQYVGRYSTFETYCLVRWGLSRSRAYQMIDAAGVSTIVDTDLDSESQARALAPFKDDPEKANEALRIATAEAEAEGAQLTAKRIKAAVDALLGNDDKTVADGGVPASESDGVGPFMPDSSPDPSATHPAAGAPSPAPEGEEGKQGHVDPSSPSPDDRAGSPDAIRARELQHVARDLKAVSRFFSEWKPEAIHELNDPATSEQVRLTLSVAFDWWNEWDKTAPKGLRSIQGGRDR